MICISALEPIYFILIWCSLWCYSDCGRLPWPAQHCPSIHHCTLCAVAARSLVAVGPSAPTSTSHLIHPLIPSSIRPPPSALRPPANRCFSSSGLPSCRRSPAHRLAVPWYGCSSKQVSPSLATRRRAASSRPARSHQGQASPLATRDVVTTTAQGTISPHPPPGSVADAQTPLRLARSRGQTCTPLHRTAPVDRGCPIVQPSPKHTCVGTELGSSPTLAVEMSIK